MKIPRIVIYFGICVFLLTYSGIILLRIMPFDFNHVVYLCQSFLQKTPELVLYVLSFICIVFLFKIFGNVISQFNFTKQLHHSAPPSSLDTIIKTHELKNKIIFYESNHPSACCIGILFPKIYISSSLISLMSSKEIEAIILHEKYHLIHKNNLMLFILSIFSFILFPFPFIKSLKNLYELHEEIAADRTAYNYLLARQPLINALKKLILYEESPVQYSFAFSKIDGVEYRLKSLVNKAYNNQAFTPIQMIISIFSFLAISSLLFIPITRTHIHAQERDIMVICYDDSNCQNMCSQNRLDINPSYTPVQQSSSILPTQYASLRQ